jgi:hypothetical protein
MGVLATRHLSTAATTAGTGPEPVSSPPHLSMRRCANGYRRFSERRKLARERKGTAPAVEPRLLCERGRVPGGIPVLKACHPCCAGWTDWRPLGLGGRPLANSRASRRRPSGVAYVFRALPFDTTIVSTTVLSGRCFTSFRLMNRPVTASRATFFPTVCGFFAMVLAPLSKFAFPGDTLILGALSVRAAHHLTGGLPRMD